MTSNKNIKFYGIYALQEKISEGAFSEIFRVTREGRDYALKKLRPYLQFDYEYTVLLSTEAFLLSQLRDSPHFPYFYEKGEQEREDYLILELIEGMNLEELIQLSHAQGFAPSEVAVCQIGLDICKGLEILHYLSIFQDKPTVHGDLRASNVMLSQKGQVKMIDLGLKGGTFDYMPLERLHDRLITPYTDIYALGHILYELLHGKRLFKGTCKLEAYMEMREIVVDQSLFRSELAPSVKEILVRCLNQDPKVRYPNLKEIKEDLESFLSRNTDPSKDLQAWVKEFFLHRVIKSP